MLYNKDTGYRRNFCVIWIRVSVGCNEVLETIKVT